MTVQMSQLPSGMRVVSHHMGHLETVSLGIWVGAGARYEALHEHGISHFLEHMAFKGTKKRSAQQIVEEIEVVGGDLNAATSMETTAYYVRVLKDDVELALDILSDILQNSTFDAEELKREKDVILQEIAASQDSPDDLVFDLMQEVAFPNQALGRPILGNMQSVSAFQSADLKNYMRSHYNAPQMVLSAAGAIDHDVLITMADRLFPALNQEQNNQAPFVQNKAQYEGGIRLFNKPIEQSHLTFAFEGPSYQKQEIYVAQLMSSLLGGGMSSRLFQEAREKRGLCYTIYSFCWGMADTGLFGVYAATGPEQVEQLADVIIEEMKKIAQSGPNEQDIKRAKAQLKAGLVMSLESSGSRAEQLARQVHVFGAPLEIDMLLERIEAITAQDIGQFASDMVQNSQLSAALVGPDYHKGGAQYNRLTKAYENWGSQFGQ